MVSWEKIIGMIIMVAVIVLAAYFLYKSFSDIYSGFNVWSDLSPSKQYEIKDALNSFTANLQECRNTGDTGCVCRNVFPNFPQTFRKEVSLEMTQSGTDVRINLLFSKNKVEGIENIVNMAKVYSIYGYKASDFAKCCIAKEEEKTKTDYIMLKFENKEGWPAVKGKASHPLEFEKDDFTIMSPDIYKGDSKSVLYLIIYPGGRWDDKIAFFSNFPKCLPDRKDAIEKFDLLITKLETEKSIAVDIPSEYRIFYGEKVIKLDYKGNDVEKMAEDKKEIVRKTDYAFDIKCREPVKPDYLVSGDVINITRTGTEFCIEKISR